MALHKCPRCDLNYILDDQPLCTVCRREVRGESEPNEIVEELCSECGEHPALPGSEYCLACLKEMNNRMTATHDDSLEHSDPTIGIDSVSTMDEIELDIDGDMGASPFGDDFDDDAKDGSQDISYEEAFERETAEDDLEEEE